MNSILIAETYSTTVLPNIALGYIILVKDFYVDLSKII